MTSPFQLFTKYLVARNAPVDAIWQDLLLPELGPIEIPVLRQLLRRDAPPSIVRYLNEGRPNPVLMRDRGFRDWAKSQGLAPFFDAADGSDPAVAAATALFLRPERRTAVGFMLLARLRPPEIVALMKEKLGVEVDAETLGRFDDLFWQAGMQEWWKRNAIKFQSEQSYLISAALQRTLTTDDVRRLLGLPSSKTSMEMLIEARDVVMGALKKGPSVAEAIQGAEMLQRLNQDISALQSAERSDLRQSRAFDLFSVRVERTPIKTLADLEGEISINP